MSSTGFDVEIPTLEFDADEVNASDLPKEGWTEVEMVNHDEIQLSTNKGTPYIRAYFQLKNRAVYDSNGDFTEEVPAFGFMDTSFWLTKNALPDILAAYKALSGERGFQGEERVEDGQTMRRLTNQTFLDAMEECHGKTAWVQIEHEIREGYMPRARFGFSRWRKSHPNRVRV